MDGLFEGSVVTGALLGLREGLRLGEEEGSIVGSSVVGTEVGARLGEVDGAS